jgi:hypothetical protein
MTRLATILLLTFTLYAPCLANVQPRPRWFILFWWEWYAFLLAWVIR